MARLLELDAQKKIGLRGLGDDLDGTYTVEEVIFLPLAKSGIEIDIIATRPDPSDPPPIVFLHDASQGLLPPTPSTLPPGTSAEEIPGRIYQAAKAAEGRSSRSGPGAGNLACAWALNLFCALPAGLNNIGTWADPNYNDVTVGVKDVVKALDGGRGRRVSRGECVPGDVVIWPNQTHIGVAMESGMANVLSNSSSKAAFTWNKRNSPSGWEYGIYRVTS